MATRLRLRFDSESQKAHLVRFLTLSNLKATFLIYWPLMDKQLHRTFFGGSQIPRIARVDHDLAMSIDLHNQLLQLRQNSLLQQAQAHHSLLPSMASPKLSLSDINRSHLIRLLMIQEHENHRKRQLHQRILLIQALEQKNTGFPVHRLLPGLNMIAEQAATTKTTGLLEEQQRPLQADKQLNDELDDSEKNSHVTNTKDTAGVTKPVNQNDVAPTAPAKSRRKDGKWLSVYARLQEYKEQHGDCIVPRGFAQDPRLASWVAEQRKQYKLYQDGKVSSITPERINLLEELDFAWSAQETAWSRNLSQLIEFKKKTGHCHVPLNHAEFPKLGLWIKEQRRHYTLWKQGRPSHMNVQRATELDRLGFCWDTHEATWMDRFKELARYKEEHGHCSVSSNNPKLAKLSTWIQHQRRQYRKHMEGKASHITPKRIEALEDLGFVWFPREKSKLDHASHDSSSSSDDETESFDSRPCKRQRR